MDKQIQDIAAKYLYDKTIKYYWNEHYFNDNRIYSSIKCKDDVERQKNLVKNIISSYSSLPYMTDDAITEVEKAIGKYEIAINKVLQCYGIKDFDFDYTANELQKLIDNIGEFEYSVKEMRTRLFCQD